jgi:serine protease Do
MIAEPPKQGVVDRGWLGITLQALTKDISEFWDLGVSGGIIVNEIVKGSPAERSGLQVGDIITQVNSQPVEVDQEEKIPVFQRLISEMGPGADVEMFVMRRNESTLDTLRLVASLGDAPIAASDAEEFESKDLELKVRSLVFSDYMINNLDPERFSGVVVSHLKMGGPAEVGGLRIGDIIQRIGDEEINNIEDAQATLEQVEADQRSEVIFFIWRQNKTLFVNVKTD